MSASDVLHPDGSDYDAFLFAEVGEDRTGAVVTVLSVLARLDLEPWTEAHELSQLAREDAQVRLTTHFKAITDIPALALASEGRAAKMVSLLPKRAPLRVSKTCEAGTNNSPELSISWTTVTLVGAVVLALVLKLFQTG
jgi:methylphosphotriester-DNA--protein-cysteine methyltransferase